MFMNIFYPSSALLVLQRCVGLRLLYGSPPDFNFRTTVKIIRTI